MEKRVNQDSLFIKFLWVALLVLIILFVYVMSNSKTETADEDEKVQPKQVLSPWEINNIANAIDIFEATYPKDICKADSGRLIVFKTPEESAEIEITCKTRKLVEYFEVKEGKTLKSVSWKAGEQNFEIKFDEPAEVLGYTTKDGNDVVVVTFEDQSILSLGVRVLR